MDICGWYIEHDRIMACEITDEETSCCGDVSACECDELRQQEELAQKIDRDAEAEQERR